MTMDASPTDTVVRVTVRRRGSLRGATSFTWWTESGTAKPGVDFSAVLPHVQQMQDGEASMVLSGSGACRPCVRNPRDSMSASRKRTAEPRSVPAP
jgi:hypothetical protein